MRHFCWNFGDLEIFNHFAPYFYVYQKVSFIRFGILISAMLLLYPYLIYIRSHYIAYLIPVFLTYNKNTRIKSIKWWVLLLLICLAKDFNSWLSSTPTKLLCRLLSRQGGRGIDPVSLPRMLLAGRAESMTSSHAIDRVSREYLVTMEIRLAKAWVTPLVINVNWVFNIVC